MRFTRWKAAGIAAGAALLVLLSGPASAVGSTSIPDATGLDYDPGCLQSTVPPDTAPPPNSIKSTGSPGGTRNIPAGDGCRGFSTYDGSAEGIDLNDSTAAVSLATGTSTTGPPPIVASWKFDGSIPAAGSTAAPDGTSATYDLPDRNFVGGNYFALYQNKTIQTNETYVACNPVPPRPTPVLQRFGTWKDGYHFFVAFSVSWDGTKWIHSAQIGEYAPDGGFGFFELGTNDGVDSDGDGNLWDNANVNHLYSTTGGNRVWSVSLGAGTITVSAPSTYLSPDPQNCDDGTFDYRFASTGDIIANVKGLTTANQVVTLPVPVPLSDTCDLTMGEVCETDIHTVGGFVFWADTTSGNSTAGLAGTNITGIALTAGAVGGTDTLGPGPTCPTPTVGGAVPQNPLFTPNTACHIDDDGTSRGSIWQEFWDTTFGFQF